MARWYISHSLISLGHQIGRKTFIMKKYMRAIFILVTLILLLFIIIHIKYVSDLQEAISTCSNMENCQVTVKDYISGESYEIVNCMDKLKIIEDFLKVKYGGVFSSLYPITENEEAYSIIISSEDVFVVLILANSQEQCRFIGEYFSISIINGGDLYLTIKNILDSMVCSA